MLIISVTLFRLMIAGRFGLSNDESHYVLFSRNLAWGYFDHPPLVAFLGALTSLFGQSVFFVRLGPIICWFLSVILLRQLALDLYNDEKIALGAAILLMLMPVQNLLAIALLPDSTLNVFWCATLLLTWRAMRQGKWSTWCFSGFFMGGAFLSKYHGILLPMCIFFYILTSHENRKWLASPKPYAAFFIGLLVFLPNVIWNYQHGWISYAYQIGHGGGSGSFKIGKVFESIGGQMGAVSPILFVLLVLSFIDMLRTRPVSESDRFVVWTSLPVFVFFCGIGLFGKVLPHWPAVGLWTGSIALSVTILRKLGAGGKVAARWRGWLLAGAVLAAAALLLVYTAIAVPVIENLYNEARNASIILSEKTSLIKPIKPFEASTDITNSLYGWDKAGRRVEEIRSTMPNPEKTFVFCHKFYTTSQLWPYLDPGTEATTLSSRPSQYLLWFNPSAHEDWDALFVDIERWRKGGQKYAPLFKDVDPEYITLNIFRSKNHLAHRFFIYKCYGFKGKAEEKR